MGANQKAYDLITKGKGKEYNSASEAIKSAYESGVTDEVIEPCIIKSENTSADIIENDDVVICFNFRTDRPREITEALTQSLNKK